MYKILTHILKLPEKLHIQRTTHLHFSAKKQNMSIEREYVRGST